MDLQIADTVLQYRRHVPLPAATGDGTFFYINRAIYGHSPYMYTVGG